MQRHLRNVVITTVVAGIASCLTSGVAQASGSLPVAQPTTTSPGSAQGAAGRYIVRLSAQPGDRAAALAAITAKGGRVLASQPTLNTAVVTASPATAAAFTHLPGVVAVVADGEARAQTLGFDWRTQSGSMTNVSRATAAHNVWAKGYTGAGVDVALIDTGVAPVPGLNDAAKVVVGPDLSFESQNADTRFLDTFGHGTNMAGIIAGREVAPGTGVSYQNDGTNFYGIAPDARIVSLKLADHAGAVDVSQIIAAIDWVVANRKANGLNVRVLNLSYGTYSKQNAQLDPLSWAAEQAWKAGITVVASTGNDGDKTVGLASPAYNPWVIAVGAADTMGTEPQRDDTVPSFSERAVNTSSRGPDVVAPGVGIVSLGVPGSKIYTDYPAAHVGNNYMRGSGTSQAAAVVSGGVALLLQQYPTMTPDAVKAHLRATATKLTGIADSVQGAGEVNFQQASDTAPATPTCQKATSGSGTGTLEGARGGTHVTIGGKQLSGEQDIMGTAWVPSKVVAATQAGTIWTSDGKFNGVYWIGAQVTGDTTSWAGRTWAGRSWAGRSWAGANWSGKTWQSGSWTGSGWSSAAWTSSVTATDFTAANWSTFGWK